VQEWPAFRACG